MRQWTLQRPVIPYEDARASSAAFTTQSVVTIILLFYLALKLMRMGLCYRQPNLQYKTMWIW